MRIESIAAEPLDIELLEPFGIATGAQLLAHNVLVRIRVGESTGLGEAAPFPAVSGETQAQTLLALERARQELLGARVTDFWAGAAASALSAAPCALAALEMAVLDAECRDRGVSLWHHFGASVSSLTTDITITTGSVDAAADAAKRAVAAGFETLKIKVGGSDIDHDIARLRRVSEIAPRARLLLDANASLSGDEAVSLLANCGAAREQVVLFEQPCAREDPAGARRVRETGVRVAADESARTVSDLRVLHAERAADIVNLKLMKSGLTETRCMLAEARRLGLGLMMGGMVETRLAMTVAACIAGGYGGFSEIDLDTPLFMRDDRLRGGFSQSGAKLELAGIGAGHGVSTLSRG